MPNNRKAYYLKYFYYIVLRHLIGPFFPEPKSFGSADGCQGRRPAGRRRPGGACAGQEIGGMTAESTVGGG